MGSNLFEGLNDFQIRAVKLTDSPLLIIAGAGSGKTKVLTRKIAYLINEKNYSPLNILGVTFTNKAASEMRSRVEEITGIDGGILNISTFHSLGLRMLREAGEKFGYSGIWQISDERDRKKIVTNIVKEKFSWFTNDMVDSLLRKIGYAKMKLYYPNNREVLLRKGFSEEEADVFSLYFKFQKDNRLWDFEDLVSLPVILMSNDERFRNRYENRFRYILVDEFQDTNPNQYEMIKLIGSVHNRITVVGDDDQAIYSWRGANVGSMADFERDFKGTKIIKLEQNYRSTPKILEFANGLIKKNHFRKVKNMWTDRTEGDSVILLFSGSKESEADYIAGIVESLPKGPEFFPVAILYRVNAQSLIFETVFQNRNIRYRVVKGLRFFDRKEVKDSVSLLRMALNEGDNLAFLRLVDFLPLGIGPKTLSEIRKRSDSTGRSFFTVLKEDFRDKFRSRPLFVKLNELHDNGQTESYSGILEELLDISGYVDYLSKKGEEDRILNIEELLNFIRQWEENETGKDYSDLLDKLVLSSVKEGNRDKAEVLMLTMHNSKGLEFPTVIIAGANATYLPFFMRKGNLEIEEERRLFYVASTRAMNRLIISTGGSRESRFISEADLGVVKIGYSNRDVISFLTGEKSGKMVEDIPKEQVVHPMFGKGVILKKMDDHKLLIDFDGKGEKVIDTSIVKLEYQE